MSRAFHDKNPEAAQRFVNALVEATKTLRDNPNLARDFSVNEALKGMSPQDWEFAANNMTFDVSLTTPTVQAYIDYMNKYDMIKQKFAAATCTDFSMLEKAKVTVGW